MGDNVVNLDTILRINSHRIVITISRRRDLLVGYLKITVVNPTNFDIQKTAPRLVLAQKAIALIQFLSCSPETYVVVAITRGPSSGVWVSDEFTSNLCCSCG